MCPPFEDSSSRLTLPASPTRIFPGRTFLLLQLAHESIAAALEQREISAASSDRSPGEPRGVFTTLYYRGGLRGCVGYVFPVTSLYRTVVESARGAAFDDSRFPPVTREEAAELEVSLSILSPSTADIRPDVTRRHGLLLKSGDHEVCLLPARCQRIRRARIAFPRSVCRRM